MPVARCVQTYITNEFESNSVLCLCSRRASGFAMLLRLLLPSEVAQHELQPRSLIHIHRM